MRKRFRSSIKAKITALLLALALIPLIIATVIMMKQTDDAIHKETESMQTASVKANADYINRWLSEKVTTLENVIKAHPEFADGKKKEILPVLKILAEADKDVKWYSFLNDKGTAHSTLGRTAQVSDQEHFQTTKRTKQVFISDVFPDVKTGDSIMIIDVPILDNEGQFTGAVQAILDPGQILSIVDSIKVADTGYGYLVAPSGKVLVHPDEQKIGKPIAAGSEANEYKKRILDKSNGFLLDGDDTVAFQKIKLTG